MIVGYSCFFFLFYFSFFILSHNLNSGVGYRNNIKELIWKKKEMTRWDDFDLIRINLRVVSDRRGRYYGDYMMTTDTFEGKWGQKVRKYWDNREGNVNGQFWKVRWRDIWKKEEGKDVVWILWRRRECHNGQKLFSIYPTPLPKNWGVTDSQFDFFFTSVRLNNPPQLDNNNL
jgi:hypothetical protein